MSTTPKQGLTELQNNAGQYLVVNLDLATIDQLLAPAIVDKDLTAAPGSPADGAMYIMASAWTGVTLTPGSIAAAAGYLIFWRNSANAWTVMKPIVGQPVRVLDEVDANSVPKIYVCKTTGATATWSVPEGSLTNPMTTSGDIIVGGASGTPARLGIGANGTVLTSNGTAASWQTPSGAGGGLTLTSKSVDYTLVLGDANNGFLHPSADTTGRTWTIPANASVAFPVGTAISFVNQNSAGAISIAITTDTMRLAGAGTTGTRTLAANGVATALKITSTEWIISGVNLT